MDRMAIRYLDGLPPNLGVVANNKRNIKSGKNFDKYFPKPSKADPYLSYNGTTYDTIGFMKDIVLKTLSDTAKIAPVLRGNTLEKTLANIFDFIYQHIQYKPDSPTEEQLRRPARSWNDRWTGVDCDCYSIFISSILTNLGIPHYFRKTKYSGRSYFQHIYVVVPKFKGGNVSNRSQYFIIDPVLDSFNTEKPFSENHDLKMDAVLHVKPVNGLDGIPIRFLNGERQNDSYFSHEAKVIQKKYGIDGVAFYDGQNVYVGVRGLNGSPQLGFLKVLKTVGNKALPFLKKIGGKVGQGIKKVFRIGKPKQEVVPSVSTDFQAFSSLLPLSKNKPSMIPSAYQNKPFTSVGLPSSSNLMPVSYGGSNLLMNAQKPSLVPVNRGNSVQNSNGFFNSLKALLSSKSETAKLYAKVAASNKSDKKDTIMWAKNLSKLAASTKIGITKAQEISELVTKANTAKLPTKSDVHRLVQSAAKEEAAKNLAVSRKEQLEAEKHNSKQLMLMAGGAVALGLLMKMNG